MARVIRFPLQMKDGAAVRTLEELREHFDLESVFGYFTTGKLKTWFADRYYDEIAQKVGALSVTSPDLHRQLCEIIGVEFSEGNADVPDIELVQRRQEKLRILSQITDDKAILDNVDAVAFDQDELYDILDEAPAVIYLYGEKFSIPYAKGGITYIGVNRPEVSLEKDEFEYNNNGIQLKNVVVPSNQSLVSIQYAEHLILQGKYQEAFPIIQKLAENGNARAMYHMALYYHDGYNTIKIDTVKRNEWLEKANSVNEPLAVLMYADLLLKNDNEKQKELFKTSFQEIVQLSVNGDAFVQCNLGNMYNWGYGVEKDESQAVEWYRKAAEQGYSNAQNNLGNMYLNGKGIEQDYRKAVEWYRKAAEQGNAIAQINLGFMYQNGKGIEQDDRKAVEWYRKAAEQGYARAQTNLGLMYYDGKCVEQDYMMAQYWYKKAAEQGYARAQYNLGLMYDKGKGAAQNYMKAVEWYRKAAEQGHSNAQNNLGVSYEYGQGVEQDLHEALYWLKKAADQGNETAKKNIISLCTKFGVW